MLSLEQNQPVLGCAVGLAAAVDHFIPWSRHPRDLAHNLVLAHGTRNSRKSALLGGTEYGHLATGWRELLR